MSFTLALEDRGFTDFSVCDAGYEKCEPSYRFGPYIRDHYLIHFVVSGKGKYKNPRGEVPVNTGEAFIIRPGEVTVYEADCENPWEYIWLGFKGKLSERFSEFSDTFTYDASITDEIREAFNMEKGSEELLTGITFKLYAKMFGGRMRNDYANKAASFINSHYMEDIKISAIAENLGLDRKYLARIFKEAEDTDMKSFLINKRLHEAKKLLLLGYSVEECAYMVGYNDPFGFSKAFKKKYKKSPIEFKKANIYLQKTAEK